MAEIVHGILIRLLCQEECSAKAQQRMDALAGEEAPSENAV